ncbi:histidine kinase [Kutzneria sp. 744]|uniref:sensor histidine kinase n=1 Tax=Kutzneria sp. (strain 744) TaxID=345341 RepID=UPI0012FAE565|nr:histidine kinase [Kutzneria sp. 744]
MSWGKGGSPRRVTWWAWLSYGVIVAEVVGGVALWFGDGWTFADGVQNFLVTDSLLAMTFALCGALVAWRRSHNPIGWLLLCGGAAHATTVLLVGLLSFGLVHGWTEPTLGVIVTAATASWPLGLRLFIPFALLLFPTGTLTRRFRPVAGLTVVIAVAFEWWSLITTSPYSVGGPPPYTGAFAIPVLEPIRPQLDLAAIVVPMLIDVVVLAVRYRDGDERQRRQMLWLMLAVLCAVPWAPFGISATSLQVLIFLQPVAMAIGLLRPQLFDIKLVVSRTLLYLLLSGAVVLLYSGVVLVFDLVLQSRLGDIGAALVALGVAIAFQPGRAWLQRGIDRLFYGDRGDPVRALRNLGDRLRRDPGSLDDLLTAVRESLRLPFAAFRLDGRETATSGQPGGRVEVLPLLSSDNGDVELVVGVRQGQSRLDPEDLRVLGVLVAPLAVAVRATVLSAELQASRQRLVSAREEERRRLRRDLHDGLGPTLSGLAFTTDAARNLVTVEPAGALELLGQLRAHANAAISEIRRLVDGLRPPAIDELGLVEALRQQADRLSYRAGGDPLRIVIDAPGGRLDLPAAVEVAAYRIVVEALTNAAKHSAADHARVQISVSDELRIEVADNGGSSSTAWAPGVGTASMAERAAEVDGWCRSGPSPGGGRVSARPPARCRGRTAARGLPVAHRRPRGDFPGELGVRDGKARDDAEVLCCHG